MAIHASRVCCFRAGALKMWAEKLGQAVGLQGLGCEKMEPEQVGTSP